MWERFSYYGMRGILILFMTNETINGGMGMSTITAGAIVGLYTASVYLVALPGGWIADRLIGQRNAIFTGGIIIASGHFTMAISSTPTFYLGLILIIVVGQEGIGKSLNRSSRRRSPMNASAF